MGLSLTNQQVNQLKKEKKFYMIGQLTEGYSGGLTDTSSLCNVKFDILELSTDCKCIQPINQALGEHYSNKYIGFDTYFKDKELTTMYDIDVRAKFIEEKLKNKLILFKPKLVVREELREHKVFKNMEKLIVIDSEAYGCSKFVRLAKFNSKLEVLLKKIISCDYIEFPEYPIDLGAPRYIFCNNVIIKIKKESFEAHPIRDTYWRFRGTEADITMVTVLDDVLYKELCTEYTMFLPEISFNKFDFIDYKDFHIDDVEKALAAENLGVAINFYTNYTEISEEMKFLLGLKEYCKSIHLNYYLSDLINLHTCIKTSFITVLAGPTGTGKSALAQAYAKMLDTSEANNNLLFLPVSPSFLEPEDVFGYYDKNSHDFVATTKLSEFLVTAEQHPEKMFIVILDEMNLSQVELWFAPMLSLLEKHEEDRYLCLYKETAPVLKDITCPAKIKIGNNVRFIGTINQDETTKTLSDRLLDRVNLVTLKQRDFASLLSDSEAEDNAISIVEKDTYDSWITNTEIAEAFSKEELTFFDAFQRHLLKISTCKCISFRALKAIATYLKNLPEGSNVEFTDRDALDLQVKQRILSKIKGTELLPNNTFTTLDEALNSCGLITFLSSDIAKKFSDFTYSVNYLKEQIREMYTYGYNY